MMTYRAFSLDHLNSKLTLTALPQLDKHTAAATPAYPKHAAHEGHCVASSVDAGPPWSAISNSLYYIICYIGDQFTMKQSADDIKEEEDDVKIQ